MSYREQSRGTGDTGTSTKRCTRAMQNDVVPQQKSPHGGHCKRSKQDVVDEMQAPALRQTPQFEGDVEKKNKDAFMGRYV